MMIDVPRLRKELEFVTTHPERWNQRHWAYRAPDCGTVACLAGTALFNAGIELRWTDEMWLDGLGANATVDGRHIHVAACELLGLTNQQAEELFHASNSLRRLWTLAAEYTDGEIQVPDDLPTWADRRSDEVT